MAQERITSTGSIFTIATLTIALVSATTPLAAQTSAMSDDGAAPTVVNNTWSRGAAMPIARQYAFVGAIGNNIYVIGGATNSEIVGVNEIYNTKTNKWTKGAPDPNPRWAGAHAVVNGILYLIGGSAPGEGGEGLTLVEAYNPVSNRWSTKSPMPTSRNSISAVVDKNVIYVIGGYSDGWLKTVESYNTTTDTWTEEAPLLVAKGNSAAGLLGATVVAAGGNIGAPPFSFTGNNEGYNVYKNKWTTLTPDPTPRTAGCFSTINGQLYFAGGGSTVVLSLNESYNPTTKSWTTLASMPKAVVLPSSAVVGGRLYCIGGSDNGTLFQGNVYNYVQIYQP